MWDARYSILIYINFNNTKGSAMVVTKAMPANGSHKWTDIGIQGTHHAILFTGGSFPHRSEQF